MQKLIVLILILNISCAASPWKIKDVSLEKRDWRFCSTDKDGPLKHRKGFCYISERCRKRFLHKEECEPLPIFCAWGDIKCMDDYKLWSKRIL